MYLSFKSYSFFDFFNIGNIYRNRVIDIIALGIVVLFNYYNTNYLFS